MVLIIILIYGVAHGKKYDNEVITMMEAMMSKNIKLVMMMNMDLPQGS
jgi:hypothetical protein